MALLSLTAVLSAVCVYQSARWSGAQTLYFNEAAAARIDAGIAAARSNELETIDVGLLLRYLDALERNDKESMTFLADHFRPEARPAIEAWLKSNPRTNRHAAESPFNLPDYKLASRAEEARHDADSARAFKLAADANRNSDDFLLLTITFATVAFLGGMSTKFRFPYHLIVVCAGTVALVFGTIRLLELPFR